MDELDKAQILQQTKQFNSAKSSKLVEILTKCIYLISQGEPLSQKEATDLFFNITHLFQYKNKDVTLRRLIYTSIKALGQQAENVYVVAPCLTADVNSKDDPTIRAAALRALCQISDSSTLLSIEPLIKQCIMDRHPIVASAAITSLLRLATSKKEIVMRYTDELYEALGSENSMVQYHALGLCYCLANGKDTDENDNNSRDKSETMTGRLIDTCIKRGLNSPLAICLLIKMIAKHMGQVEVLQWHDHIKSYLTHPVDLVSYQAASSLVAMNSASSLAVAVLRNYLASNQRSLRFGALRALNWRQQKSNANSRYWSIHRIGDVCKLHLLNKRYKISDQILGILDFSQSKLNCAKYVVILQCEQVQLFEFRQEFCLGLKKNDFMITIPHIEPGKLASCEGPHAGNQMEEEGQDESAWSKILHCVLSFLFYIADEKNYQKSLFEDRAGTIELGPSELDTRLFSCDFPIAIHTS